MHSTNYPHLTGDALDIAKKHNVRLEHLDYVQIHPTTLYSKRPGRRFLISESVRGEGAVLYNSKKERFVNELLPRDVVTNAIREEMKKEGTDHVWLSMENIDKEVAKNLGIELINSPEGNRDSVAEHVIGMLLILMNRLFIASNEVKNGIWKREENRGDENLAFYTKSLKKGLNDLQAFANRWVKNKD